jgi:hypothetical protein
MILGASTCRGSFFVGCGVLWNAWKVGATVQSLATGTRWVGMSIHYPLENALEPAF